MSFRASTGVTPSAYMEARTAEMTENVGVGASCFIKCVRKDRRPGIFQRSSHQDGPSRRCRRWPCRCSASASEKIPPASRYTGKVIPSLRGERGEIVLERLALRMLDALQLLDVVLILLDLRLLFVKLFDNPLISL